MLGLLQILNFMFEAGYTESEVRSIFSRVKGLYDLETLCADLGIEVNPILLQAAAAKLSNFESAMFYINMRRGA